MDESTRLLIPTNKVSNDSSTSLSRGRPPLFTVPSYYSLKSSASGTNLNDLVATCDEDDLVIFQTNIDNFDHFVTKNYPILDNFAYFSYYIPILRWVPNYNFRESIVGDLLASLCMTSFQIPLVMSFATSLAHLPPVSGLYSVIISSAVYSIFGTVPVLIVGPSGAAAIIYGQIIDEIRHESSQNYSALEISSAITAGIGGVLLALGLLRLGFLDNILSRSLLKGFLAALGVIMIVNELAIEMGLSKLAASYPHITTIDKVVFAVKHCFEMHKVTTVISISTLAIVMTIRKGKSYFISKYNMKKLVYIPDLLLMVVAGTYFCWKYEWYNQGVEIMGDISVKGPIKYTNPFSFSKFSLYKKTFHTAFICTVLGLFDSIVATKSLDAKFNYNVSTNRELVAIGLTNFLNSLVSGLPSFGGFGRSKINLMAGGTTPMTSMLMAFFTIVSTIYLLPYLRFLPESILALTTTITGITLLEEIPEDIIFLMNVRGYAELITFVVVFCSTIVWSAQSGVYLGVLIAVVRTIKHGSRSNIQILGRVPNTNIFRDADALIEESFDTLYDNQDMITDDSDKLTNFFAEIEQIEGIVVIKIPEPLTFANIDDLKRKITRIEKYGSLMMHPSQPRTKERIIRGIVFDCKGMNKVDATAVQVLHEMVCKYIGDGISICFARVAVDTQLRDQLRRSSIVDLVNNNIRTQGSSLRLGQFSTSSLGDGFFRSIEEGIKAIENGDKV